MVDIPEKPTKPNHIYLMYMYKEDSALNNLQWLISQKNQPTNQPTNQQSWQIKLHKLHAEQKIQTLKSERGFHELFHK